MSDSGKARRDESLLEQLDPATSRMLFPERVPQPLRVTLLYPPLDEATAAAAAEPLARAESYEETPVGQSVVTFTLDEADALHDLFALVDGELGSAAVEVRINDLVLPMTRELWLPLFWSLRS